jgi:hypothetical protein
VELSADDGVNQILITGESTKETVKTIARGVPGDSGVTVVTTAGEHFYPFLPTRLRVHRAPGIPCALCIGGQDDYHNFARKHAARS